MVRKLFAKQRVIVQAVSGFESRWLRLYGLVVEMVKMSPFHGDGCGFDPRRGHSYAALVQRLVCLPSKQKMPVRSRCVAPSKKIYNSHNLYIFNKQNKGEFK